jgi:hypothetical protein
VHFVARSFCVKIKLPKKLPKIAKCLKCLKLRYSIDFKKRKKGLGSNIGHRLFVGWVEHLVIFCWVSFLYPTYSLSIFVLSAKPNKMAEDRTIPEKSKVCYNIYLLISGFSC